jgi:anaerobic C4-dicarboxylate transporter
MRNLPGGGARRTERDVCWVVVVMVSVAVAEAVPFRTIAGGDHVQVVSCGRLLLAQPRSTTWLKPFVGATVTV